MGANLVGFAVGVDGISYMIQQMTVTFVACAIFVLFCAAQIMFEVREHEFRITGVRYGWKRRKSLLGLLMLMLSLMMMEALLGVIFLSI